jgi:indole-3-glycerol phosphate synthase
MGLLAEILSQKQAEIAGLGRSPLPAPPARRPVELARRTGEPLRLIAEIKRRSPSAGSLSTRLAVGERAERYERAGARMVSVLTDSRFFDGAFEHLAEARAGCSLPLLCKDFVLDERQLERARAFGADAALLIVRCLEAPRVQALVETARRLELEPLVEVTTESEAALAVAAGARLIGVNARDLDSLEVDSERAARVLCALPPEVVAIHLSGLGQPADVTRVAKSRADAALIGEALMRQDDPEALLRGMVVAAGVSSTADR